MASLPTSELYRPERKHLHQVPPPLKSALKLPSVSLHYPFLHDTSPDLPQDSNTDAADLEVSMMADSGIACTPPLCSSDTMDDIDDLFSPLSPISPLTHFQYPYNHAQTHHPLDSLYTDIFPFPDKTQVAQRLHLTHPTAMATAPAAALPTPVTTPSTRLPAGSKPTAVATETTISALTPSQGHNRRRPTVTFDLGDDDDDDEEEEEKEDKGGNDAHAKDAQVLPPSSSALFSFDDAPLVLAASHCSSPSQEKGVDVIQHDLSSLSLDQRKDESSKKSNSCNAPRKTDDLLDHILVKQAPQEMLVALFDRPSELQALAARNADFFKVLYAQVGSSALAGFKQILFSSREDMCDLIWMQELARHLKAQPCVLEKFKNLVGWVGPDDSESESDDRVLWGEDEYSYRDSSYEQVQIKWIRDFPEQLAAFRDEYPQFFVNARERLEGKRLSFGGDRRDLYEIFCETLFLTREQLKCDNAWTRRVNACLEKYPELLLQLKEIVAFEVGYDV